MNIPYMSPGLSPRDILRSAIRIDLFDDPSRVSNSHNPIREIFCNHTSSSNRHSIPNSDSWNDNDTSSEPAIFSYPDCFGPFSTVESVSLLWGDGMSGGVKLDVGT